MPFVATKDPRYVQGKALLKANQFDAAIDAFVELLEAMQVQFGDQHLETAPILFEYGSALLLKAETAADLFGDGIKEEGAGDANEDLEIAWEVLEVARGTLVEHTSEDARILLARVYLRLADLSLDSGNCEQAIQDYHACLEERLDFLSPSDRRLADVHSALAVAYLYNSARHEHPAEQRKLAIEHYTAAARVIEMLLRKIYEETGSPTALSALPKSIPIMAEGAQGPPSRKRKGNRSNQNFAPVEPIAAAEMIVDWTAAMKNGWHPASAVNTESGRLPNKKKIRPDKQHPAAFITKAEVDISELCNVLSELREKVADTVKLNDEAGKQAASGGATSTPAEGAGKEQNVYANSGFDRSSFAPPVPPSSSTSSSVGVTTIGFGNTASVSADAPTPDAKSPPNAEGVLGNQAQGSRNVFSSVAPTAPSTVAADGSVTSLGFSAPTMTAPANLLSVRRRDPKRKGVGIAGSAGISESDDRKKRVKLVSGNDD